MNIIDRKQSNALLDTAEAYTEDIAFNQSLTGIPLLRAKALLPELRGNNAVYYLHATSTGCSPFCEMIDCPSPRSRGTSSRNE